MFRAITLLIQLVCLTLIASSNATANDEILLFEDPAGTKTYDEVMANPQWFERTSDTSRGFSDSVFWIKQSVVNVHNTPNTLVVQFESLRLPLVTEFLKTQAGVRKRDSGYLSGLDMRPSQMHLTSFPVQLEANANAELFYRIESRFKVDLGFNVLNLSAATKADSDKSILGAMIFAALLMLLLYNLILALLKQDALYLYYSAFLLSISVVSVAYFRLYELLGYTMDSVYLEAYSGVSLYAFAYLFLSELFKENHTKTTKRLLAVGYIILAGHLFLEPYTLIKSYADWAGPIVFFVFTYLVINAWRQQNPLAKYVMVGWIGYALCSLMYVANLKGLVGAEFEYIVSFGNLFEGLVFSGVLAYRLRNANRTTELLHVMESTLTKQKELFAIVGHELRTPVATIKMLTKDSSIKDRDGLVQIGEISDGLLQVLEDMRVVISPERALESRPVVENPYYLVQRALNSLKVIVTDRGMTLSMDGVQRTAASYKLHAQALRQAVTNLVKNSALHSGGTDIQVSFEIYTVDGITHAVLKVEDDGKGIPADKVDRMFEAFSRGDSTQDGSGLGLYIVKQLAERLGGQIRYSQSPLGGACFALNFALGEEVEALKEIAPEPTPINLEGMRVLFAEDDNTLRMLTERMLIKKGAIVTSCVNGKEAFDKFDPEQFDLVVTDLMMPEMDGHELTRALRASGANVPIIAVTAAVIGSETQQFLKEGADAVLSKPLSAEHLKEALTKIKADRYDLVGVCKCG